MSDMKEKLKNLTTLRGINNIKLAELSELDITTLQNIIYGRTRKIEYIERIATVLGVTTKYLLGTENNISHDHVNTKHYFEVIRTIENVLNQCNVTNISHSVLLDIFYIVYDEILKNDNQKHLVSFTYGIIKSKILSKLIIQDDIL